MVMLKIDPCDHYHRDDTIDDIWEEYYKCHLNNGDAEVLFPIHQTLLLRGIYPQEYLKQEFDWTRSAFGLSNRNEYLTVEREGRKIPMAESDRKYILEGLKSAPKLAASASISLILAI